MKTLYLSVASVLFMMASSVSAQEVAESQTKSKPLHFFTAMKQGLMRPDQMSQVRGKEEKTIWQNVRLSVSTNDRSHQLWGSGDERQILPMLGSDYVEQNRFSLRAEFTFREDKSSRFSFGYNRKFRGVGLMYRETF